MSVWLFLCPEVGDPPSVVRSLTARCHLVQVECAQARVADTQSDFRQLLPNSRHKPWGPAAMVYRRYVYIYIEGLGVRDAFQATMQNNL